MQVVYHTRTLLHEYDDEEGKHRHYDGSMDGNFRMSLVKLVLGLGLGGVMTVALVEAISAAVSFTFIATE